MSNPIRVLVVEDSLTVRKHLVEILAEEPGFEVVGETGDGKEAIELCRTLRPDVMSLDMVLETMSGVAVTEYVMAYTPTPILIVSSSTNRGTLLRTYDALAAGAVEVFEKPRGDETDETWARRYAEALRLVSRIRAITHPRARLGAWGRSSGTTAPGSAAAALSPAPPPRGSPARAVAGKRPAALVIGASTGGPVAVASVVGSLPKNFPLPILIVLHVSPLFGSALAEWLEHQCRRPVALARDGQPLPAAGMVALAPADQHLVVRDGRLWLTRGPPRHSCRPSVDELFESAAAEWGPGVIGCLLTGMGADGAVGLLALRRAGAFTIAQDEASSTVFGMPKEAIALGAAERVLSVAEIGAAIAAVAAAASLLEETP